MEERESAAEWRIALRGLLRSARLEPGNVKHVYGVGVVYLGLGREQEAAQWFRRALRLGISDAEVLRFLAMSLGKMGRREDAARAWRIRAESHPANPEFRQDAVTACLGTRRYEEALAHARVAAEADPANAKFQGTLAHALGRARRYDEAIAQWRRVLDLDPGDGYAWNNLGDLLIGLGDTAEGLRSFRRAIELAPHPEIHSNLLLALHYSDASREEIAREHREWAARYFPDTPRSPKRGRRLQPWRKLRVGYVSGDLRDHSVALLMGHVWGAHRRDRFHVAYFPTTTITDAVTKEIQAHADEWLPVEGIDDDAAAELIESREIDILVDLSGHTASHRLGIFARKPAPVQVTYCGYPDTTGLAAIDYRITDRWCDPPGETEHLNSERLIRLACGFIGYRAPKNAPRVAPLPALRRGYITFGCLAGRHKISDEMLELWAGIVRATDGSRLVLKCGGSESGTEALRRRLAQWGLDRSRVTIHGFTPRAEHMRMYGEIDLALDTFPYAGTVGTCEALWMGVPVLTLAGRSHVSRVGVSLLSRAGLGDWVAESTQEYAALATRFARDFRELARIRAGLRGRMQRSSLSDPRSVTAALEGAYRSMWREHVGRPTRRK